MTDTENKKPLRTIYLYPGQTTTVVIDSLIRPIYPVRYAYANFFGDDLVEPARPPALQTLLHQTNVMQKNVKATHGYVARLLRPGWVYIKEEKGGDYFHIFRYKHVIKPDGSTQEQFHKYKFNNKINAQRGILPEYVESSFRGYPFAFVRKEVSEVSIVYCEEPLSNQLIDELNGNADKRAAFMQRIDLIGEGDGRHRRCHGTEPESAGRGLPRTAGSGHGHKSQPRKPSV
jgi:hypothetical protein